MDRTRKKILSFDILILKRKVKVPSAPQLAVKTFAVFVMRDMESKICQID